MVTRYVYNRPMNDRPDYFQHGEPAQRLPFGRALKVRREKLGYTQNDVAAKLGLTATTITKLEQRMDPPRNRGYLKELARVYLGSVEELLSGFIPQGFPMHRKEGNTIDETPASYTAVWDMTNPTDRKARLKVAWDNVEEAIAIIARIAPNELWRVVEKATVAQRNASMRGGVTSEVLEGEFEEGEQK